MQIEKAFIILLSIFLISGCVPFDEGKIRHEQTQEFQSDYIRLTENVLKEKAPLDLWDCIELALQNNLHVRQAELEAGIAKLERRIAFANFLPVIELSGRSLSLDHQPMLRAGETNSDSLWQQQRLGPSAIHLSLKQLLSFKLGFQLALIILPPISHSASQGSAPKFHGFSTDSSIQSQFCLKY